jgi:polysaccharide pyruvyl transferase WcaK-like protein
MQPTNDRIALLHHVGGGNLGDDATLDTVLQNLKRLRPNAVMAAFTINPDDTKQRHQIPSYPIRTTPWVFGYTRATAKSTWKSTIRALARQHRFLFFLPRLCYDLARIPKTLYSEVSFLVASRRIISSFDLLIISGGGQLTEWGGPWAFPYTLFKWVLLAKSARLKCLFLNVGAGPLSHPLSKFFVRRALTGADYVSFRDDQSRLLASQIGFKGSGQVFPDCVYSRDVRTLNTSAPRKSSQLVVGIAPMPYWGHRVDPSEKNSVLYQGFIDKLATFAASLVKDSYLLRLFGTDIGVDPLAIEDLQLSLLKHHNVATAEYSSVRSIDELLSSMSAVDYVVTCRFHGVVLAHLLNKPVLALSPHPKVRTLMNDLGLSKYCLDIRTFDAKLLADTFAFLVADTDEVKRHMAACLAEYRSRLMSQFDELFADEGKCVETRSMELCH